MNGGIQIATIADLTGARVIGNSPVDVRHVATDSRTLSRTDHVMFVAIRGANHNGNDYLEEVHERGIRVFLTDQEPGDFLPNTCYLVVDDALPALQILAAHIRSNFPGTVIGITGSNGKTIVKEWLYQLLQDHATVYRSPRSFNSQLGVPLSVWQLDDSYKIGIIEAGISRPGEMARLQEIIHPSYGILTNIGPAHSENFSSDSEKLEEKLALFSGTSKVICRIDQVLEGKPLADYLANRPFGIVDWSIGGKATYVYFPLASDSEGSSFLLKKGDEEMDLHLPVTGKAAVEDLLHAITLMLELGYGPELVRQSLSRIEPVEMRLETLKGIFGSMLVNDVYNSDLAGLSVALDVLDQIPGRGKKTVILSEVYQSGKEPEELYEEVASVLNFRKVDQICCVGDTIGEMARFFPEGTQFYSDTPSFIRTFNRHEIAGAAVLIKGARKFHFEDITRFLQQQVHHTILEINLDNLAANLNYFRSITGKNVKIMVMVKALSYGSGVDEIASFLQHQQVDYLAVAFPDEGVRLREAGVKLPVMVMNADQSDLRTMIEHNLEPEIYNMDGLLEFVRISRYLGLPGYPVHIKLDTGMHRLGFEEADIEHLCEVLVKNRLVIQSVFTHLAASEDPEHDEFTRKQAADFERMAAMISDRTGQKPFRHVVNSAGIERFPRFHFEMVRLGIGLYGIGNASRLVPVSTFRTVISQVREVAAGETIGYNRMGKVDRPSRIATIPVGYADGISRKLGNGNYSFLIHGQKVPTIGNICMDMTMLDITDVDATEGDNVELFGQELPVEKMAETLGTIVYEVLTGIPERVKRVYIRE